MPTLNSMKEFIVYAVQVFAVNDVGTSKGSEIIIQTTTEATPPPKLSGVRVASPSSTKVLVEWFRDHPRIPFYFENWFMASVAASISDTSHSRPNGTLNRHMTAATKSPPHPSPGSVLYSDDDDDDVKDGQLYGSSSDSITEKPSEYSSSGLESDSDREEANHFVNHYANVNVTLKKNNGSWRKRATSYVVGTDNVNMPCRPPPPVPVPGPPSYQTAVSGRLDDIECPSVNLNGGRIIVNNMAGSRAPLPGFSSFV